MELEFQPRYSFIHQSFIHSTIQQIFIVCLLQYTPCGSRTKFFAVIEIASYWERWTINNDMYWYMMRRVMLERKAMRGADRGWRRGAILDEVAFLLHRCGCGRGAPCRLTEGSLTPQHAFFPNRTGSLSAMDTAMDSVHRFGKFSKAC